MAYTEELEILFLIYIYIYIEPAHRDIKGL